MIILLYSKSINGPHYLLSLRSFTLLYYYYFFVCAYILLFVFFTTLKRRSLKIAFDLKESKKKNHTTEKFGNGTH